jgi:hypothetical protein
MKWRTKLQPAALPESKLIFQKRLLLDAQVFRHVTSVVPPIAGRPFWKNGYGTGVSSFCHSERRAKSLLDFRGGELNIDFSLHSE